MINMAMEIRRGRGSVNCGETAANDSWMNPGVGLFFGGVVEVDRHYAEALLAALESSIPDVRERSAYVLKLLAEPALSLRIAERVAQHDDEPYLASVLVEAIAASGDPRAAEALEPYLAPTYPLVLRQEVYRAIAELVPAMRRELLREASQDPSSRIREWARQMETQWEALANAKD